MKNPKISILAIVTAVAINIISVLCGIMIWQCEDMLPTSKYSFTCIILAAVGFATYFFVRLLQSGDENTVKKLTAQIAEKDKKISQLASDLLDQKQSLDEIEVLQNKCQALESFRKSFPLTVKDSYTVYTIIRYELTATFSKWLICGIYDGELWSLNLVRTPEQLYKDMISLVESTDLPQEIQKFDLSEKLFWE